MPLEGPGRAIAGAVVLRSLVVVKGPTGPGTRLPSFFSRRRGAELRSRKNELSFLVLDDAKFRALVWSFGPSISFVHSGRVLRAELALCALVERNGAGVLTEGRRRWPARLKILGLRLRSGDREFDVRGADVEKPSSARNPKDKPVLLGVGVFDLKRAHDGGAIVVAGAAVPGWTCAGAGDERERSRGGPRSSRRPGPRPHDAGVDDGRRR